MSLHEQLLAAVASDGLIHGCGECGQHHDAEAALRAVVELHAPVPETLYGNLVRHVCEGCDHGAYAEESPDWPCRTVQAIARELGIEAGEGRGQPCCDLHGRNCEQGGEECCERCTEAHHFAPGHGGVPCSSPVVAETREGR